MMPVSRKEFLDIQVTVTFRLTLKRVRDMIITYSHKKLPLVESTVNFLFHSEVWKVR